MGAGAGDGVGDGSRDGVASDSEHGGTRVELDARRSARERGREDCMFFRAARRMPHAVLPFGYLASSLGHVRSKTLSDPGAGPRTSVVRCRCARSTRLEPGSLSRPILIPPFAMCVHLQLMSAVYTHALP